MQNLEVRMERLPAMRMAEVRVKSESPEGEALDKIIAWAKNKGMAGQFRVFGFDNCQPHPNHIYTTWLPVEQDVRADDAIHIKDFPGGLFAVTRVKHPANISTTWKKLVEWAQANHHAMGRNPGLEEIVSPPDAPEDQLEFDLYLSLAG